MAGAREWMGEFLLRSPASLRSLRKFPLLGGLIHRLSHTILPAGEKVWARIASGPAEGIWMEINPRTGREVLRGEAERASQLTIAERLRPGDIFYDLGANIGFFSLLAARLVGERGKVFSFEPDSSVAGRLRRNVARNGFGNVTVVEAGVWSKSGEASFDPSDASSPDRGTGRIALRNDGANGTRIRCVSLDDFSADFPPPDGIKCDVEGAEVEAMSGAKNLLREKAPWILCEMHSASNEASLREAFGGLGYQVEAVDGNHILATRRLQCEAAKKGDHQT